MGVIYNLKSSKLASAKILVIIDIKVNGYISDEAIPLFSLFLPPSKVGVVGWAMVLGNFQGQRVLLIWIIHVVGQGPTVLAVGVGG